MQAVVDSRGRRSPHGYDAAQLALTATMLLDRDSPDAAHAFQRDSHAEAIAELRRSRSIIRRGGSKSGKIAHAGLFGLTMRGAGPGTLIVPALMHHDQGRRQLDNSDVVVVDPTVVRRAQLKNYCLGFCLGACGDEKGELQGEKDIKRYMEDVVLVGRCDIVNPEARHSLNGLARRLQREARGVASKPQVDILDEGTLHVLQTIIDPEDWRMGMRPMAKSMAFSY